MKGRCSICGKTIRSRESSKASAKANFLAGMRKHQWKKHRNTMISRIKAGKKASALDNPSLQDFVSALQEGVRGALQIYGQYTERQYQHIKSMMDALDPVLPIAVIASWEAIEAIHDWEEEKRRK